MIWMHLGQIDWRARQKVTDRHRKRSGGREFALHCSLVVKTGDTFCSDRLSTAAQCLATFLLGMNEGCAYDFETCMSVINQLVMFFIITAVIDSRHRIMSEPD